jgi:hypothetical protein
MTVCEKEYTVNMVENVCDQALIPQFTVNGINGRMLQPTTRQRLSNIATLTFSKAHGWPDGTKVLARQFAAGYDTPFLNATTPTPEAITGPSATQISYANTGPDEPQTPVAPSPSNSWVGAVYEGVVNTVPTVIDTSISLGSPIVSWSWLLRRVRYVAFGEAYYFNTTLSGQFPVWPQLFPGAMGEGAYFNITLTITNASGLVCAAINYMPQLLLDAQTYPNILSTDIDGIATLTRISTFPIVYYSASSLGVPVIADARLIPFPYAGGATYFTNGPDSGFRWRIVLFVNGFGNVIYYKLGQSVEGTYGPASSPPAGDWPLYITISP